MLELQVLNGPLQWQTIKVAGPRFLVGRRDGCHLVLKDGWISREHAVLIEKAPGEYVVHDLESENGIFVNNVRVTEAPLRHSDVLRIGRTEMRIFSAAIGPADNGDRRESTVRDHESRLALRESSPGQTSPERPLPFGDVPTDPASLDMTVHEPGGARGARTDLRERLRRIERILQEKEEDNARLAVENAVFKRAMAAAGLIDRQTGEVDVRRLRTPAPRAVVPPGIVPLMWNPLARPVFPDPDGGVIASPSGEGEADLAMGTFRLGVIGAGAAGARLADAFYRIGWRRAICFSAKAEALEDLEIPAARCVRILLPAEPASVRPAEPASLRPAEPASPPPAEPASLDDGRRAVAAAQLQLVAACRDGLGADRTLNLLLFGLGGVTGAGSLGALLEIIGEYEKLSRGDAAAADPVPCGVVMAAPSPAEIDDAGGRELVLAGVDAARKLLDAGRLRPFIVVENRRLAAALGGGALDEAQAQAQANATVAGAIDALNRLSLLSPLAGQLDAEAMRSLWLSPGMSTIGIAATRRAADPEAVKAAVRHALTDGLLLGSVPASRARQAAVVAAIGSEVLAGGAAMLNRLESAVEVAEGILPQARPLTGIYEVPGDEVRVISFLGGLPFPENLV